MTRYTSLPRLPERIARLEELAIDLWWSWHPEARTVFRGLDYGLWRATAHNPVRMLWLMPRTMLEAAASDPAFLQLYDRAIAALDDARAARNTWWASTFPSLAGQSIASFCAEFALHQSLPIYAGGLGVLAGDHCKEASDLGVPLVGVGFMYPQGYFHQRMSSEGWQEELYEKLDWDHAPVKQMVTKEGTRCVVPVPLGKRVVYVLAWIVRLGRVKIFLLDTSINENAPEDRELSARLYGGDSETRLQQEIILGLGGVRVLRALGYEPSIWHLNEGHTAFVAVERICQLMEGGESFDGALEQVRHSTIFTTHTPVAAGHDAFPLDLVESYLAARGETITPHLRRLLALGQYNSGGGPLFNMTALAIRGSSAMNAVSRVHGKVTKKMWASMWPNVAAGDRPVNTVTNGVHVPSWIAPDMARLFDRHLQTAWRDHHDRPDIWKRLSTIPDEELWIVRNSLRSYLIAFIRE